jgi:hypothetical protein
VQPYGFVSRRGKLRIVTRLREVGSAGWSSATDDALVADELPDEW